MRKFFFVFGIAASIAVLVVAAGIAVMAHRGNALDVESRAFVDEAVPAITARWEQGALLERASVELRSTLKPAELSSFFRALSQFGPLVEYRGATGDSTMHYGIGSEASVSANYVARARYENGDAVFRIILIKREGRWFINGFHVDREPPSLSRLGGLSGLSD